MEKTEPVESPISEMPPEHPDLNVVPVDPNFVRQSSLVPQNNAKLPKRISEFEPLSNGEFANISDINQDAPPQNVR